jgi:organic hydroperoxide reductase OsmC/OhrA
MKPYPHHYSVEASGAASGSVNLEAHGLPAITSAPPIEFDGPGDQWSPESLLVAAVADCFVFTFRAIARASKLEWSNLRCRAHRTLDHVDRVTRFVAMRIEADLTLPADGNADAARRLLEKAEKSCLITNSLDLTAELEASVTVE